MVGDLQRTSVWEFWREQNDEERAQVVQHIAQGHPALVLMMGDLVFDGSSDSEWAAFDALVGPLREAQLPALSVAGNHDLWLLGRRNLRHLWARFPSLRGSSWTEMTWAGIAFLILDSNRDSMSEQEWQRQLDWASAELDRLQADPTVHAIVAAAHHPALTNSTVSSDNTDVSRLLVPLLRSSPKTVLVLAGHVHSYERFVSDGIHFVVCGGGGGPRVDLLTGNQRRHPDDQITLPSPRPFHVLWLEPTDAGIAVDVEGLPKGGTEFSSIDRFLIPWPAAEPDTTAHPRR